MDAALGPLAAGAGARKVAAGAAASIFRAAALGWNAAAARKRSGRAQLPLRGGIPPPRERGARACGRWQRGRAAALRIPLKSTTGEASRRACGSSVELSRCETREEVLGRTFKFATLHGHEFLVFFEDVFSVASFALVDGNEIKFYYRLFRSSELNCSSVLFIPQRCKLQTRFQPVLTGLLNRK